MIYSTNCPCKRNKFDSFKKAREHVEECDKATVVYYEGPYGREVAYDLDKHSKKAI